MILASWSAVAGWFTPQVWFAGLALVTGAVIWWRKGPSWVSAMVVGLGAAWAWQPCVGEELAQVLNAAQSDPVTALPGLAAFMFGVSLVGLGLGAILGLLLDRVTDKNPNRIGALIVGLLGVSMIVGVYPSIASVFARWSTSLWA